MGAALISLFAHNAGEVEIGGSESDAHFFMGFSTGTIVGRFPAVRFQFASTGTPQSLVRFLGPFEQEDPILRIEDVEQRGDLVWERHGLSLAEAIEGFRRANKDLMSGDSHR